MDNERRQLIEICDAYYNDGLTQQQIANQTGLSRMKISRLLQKAKDRQIVSISIDYSGVYLDVEKKLVNQLNLEKAIVVPNIGNQLKAELGNAAGFYLNQVLKSGDTVAVGWGTTVRESVNYCAGDFNGQVLFAPIIGGHGKSELNLHATTISADLAKRLNGRSVSLLAPAFSDSLEDKQTWIKDSYVQEVIETTKKANKAFFSLGSPVFEKSTIHKTGYFSEEDLLDIKESGAICDIVSIVFLNEKGEKILETITDRSIGISREELKKIPEKICVAGGTEKHEAIKIAVEAGYIDTLITDKMTAEYLLKE